MYRNCTNNCCCYPYDPCYGCYANYCCYNPATNACECRCFVGQNCAGNTKCCSFRRISDMPSKKKSSFDSIEKPKKKKKMQCTCDEKHMTLCKRIQEIDKKLGRCKCNDDPCSDTAPPPPPIVNDFNRKVNKREVYLLPYYGVPIKKNKKYILECTSFESADASCNETPDNNQTDWCPRLPPECDTNEPMDTARRERSALPRPQTGKSNFVGRCSSFESFASLQANKRNSCHCCCSRKATNSKSKRQGSSPIGKSWSQLDVIDEEDIDLMDDFPQPAPKNKSKDYTSRTQGNASKSQSPRKYDASPLANASANRNARGSAKSSGNACGISSCCAPSHASVRGNSKSSSTGYAYVNATASRPKDYDYCNDTMDRKTVESKMQKSLEDSCADFLNIVTDNILETVQTSVSVTLKDYCTKTTEKIEQAFEKLEQNDVAMRCLCGRLMEKLTEQNERDYEKILCLLEQLKDSQQSKQNSVERIYMHSRASQYEVIESSDCGFEQSVKPCYGPHASYGRESNAAQKTNPESGFSGCCGQQSMTPPQASYVQESNTAPTTNPESGFRACCESQSASPPQSSPESAKTSMTCCIQDENLENGNGKNGNGKNGSGKNRNGKNGNGKNGNGKNGYDQNGKGPDEIVVNEIQTKDNENQELVGKVIIPPCTCCHKCTCTPKTTAPPRPNICLETDEKKKGNSRECGGSSDHYEEEGEETLSPSGYHFVSDKYKPKANVLENKTPLNNSTKCGNRPCNSNAITVSASDLLTAVSINSSKKTVFQSTTNNSAADVPACCAKDKNTPELDLYGNYDTSGYATEPEDNNDGIDGTSARNNSTKKSQFLPVTLQYVRNDPVTKTGTTTRNTTNKKKICKKRITGTSKSPSSRLSRL